MVAVDGASFTLRHGGGGGGAQLLPPGLKGNKFPQSCRAARLPRGCRTVAALVPQERRTALGRCRASAARVPHVYSTHATQVPRRYHARTHLVRHEAVSFFWGGLAGREESVHRAAAKPLASTRGVPALLSQSMARKLQPRAFGLSLQVLAAVHVALRCVGGMLRLALTTGVCAR